MSTTTAGTEAATARSTGRGGPWATLVAVAFGVIMVALDGTIVAIANPAIGKSLHASLSDLQWITNGYLLALAVFLMLVARPASVWASTALNDFTGRERLLLGWAGLRGAVPIVLALIARLGPVITKPPPRSADGVDVSSCAPGRNGRWRW